MGKLEGKNVLVTGASSGIGQAIAVRFAQEGANVAMNYRGEPQEVRQTREMVRAGCSSSQVRDLPVKADVSQEDQVQEMFRQVIESFGSLDVLINNAGIQIPTPSHEIQMSDFDRVLGVNLRGAFLCAREALRHFVARGGGGVIVNNSSVHEIIPQAHVR